MGQTPPYARSSLPCWRECSGPFVRHLRHFFFFCDHALRVRALPDRLENEHLDHVAQYRRVTREMPLPYYALDAHSDKEGGVKPATLPELNIDTSVWDPCHCRRRGARIPS